jgi:TM2 domain-containing membrane protein YozV
MDKDASNGGGGLFFGFVFFTTHKFMLYSCVVKNEISMFLFCPMTGPFIFVLGFAFL